MDPTTNITKAEIIGDVTPAINPESVEKEKGFFSEALKWFDLSILSTKACFCQTMRIVW